MLDIDSSRNTSSAPSSLETQQKSKQSPEERQLQTALRTLKGKLAPEIVTLMSDADLHRFLVQRHFDIDKVVVQVREFHEWYTSPMTSLDIPHKHLRPMDLLHYFDRREDRRYGEYGFNSFLGRDLVGRPIYWEKSGKEAASFRTLTHDAFTEDMLFARHIRDMEILHFLSAHSSSPSAETTSTNSPSPALQQHIVVMDLEGLPLFPDVSLLHFIQRIHSLDRFKYPESLAQVFLLHTPATWRFFHRLLTSFISQNTLDKLRFLGDATEFVPVLQQFIAPENIPVEYGGSCVHFSWHWPANLPPEARTEIKSKSSAAASAIGVQHSNSSNDHPTTAAEGDALISHGSDADHLGSRPLSHEQHTLVPDATTDDAHVAVAQQDATSWSLF